MLIAAVGELLPLAMAVALTPFLVIAAVLMLGTARPIATGSAFAVGWAAGLALLTLLVYLFVGEVDDRFSRSGDAWVQIVVGVVLIGAALRKWRTRPRAGASVRMPRWAASIQGVTPAKAALIGAGLGGANPKNVALALAAASSIAYARLSPLEAAVAIAVFTLLGSSTAIGAVAARAFGGAAAARSLGAIKTFMLQNNNIIMMVVLLLIGVVVLGNGLAGAAVPAG